MKEKLFSQNKFKIQIETQASHSVLCAMLPLLEMEILQYHQGTNKMNQLSAIARLFTQEELRLSTPMRECTANIYT